MKKVVLYLLLINFTQNSYAQKLIIKNQTLSKSYTAKELLNHTESKTVTFPLLNYPNYEFEITVVPISKLFKTNKIPEGAVVQFKCQDGFSGFLDKSLLLQDDILLSKAFIAVENPNKPWPILPKQGAKKSAGPFYLVWQNPEASKIPPEFWPYQLDSLEVISDTSQYFPNTKPDPKLAVNDPILNGFTIYQKRCMTCHKINGEGTSAIGPDLNLPMNPTEYFQEAALKKFIQDPKSVRSWSSMTMNWVTSKSFNEQEINDLVAYLKHMSARKIK